MSSKTVTKDKPKVAFWAQIQSILNTINHVFILLIGIYVTLLARSLNFQDTAMHMFMAVIGVSKPGKCKVWRDIRTEKTQYLYIKYTS